MTDQSITVRNPPLTGPYVMRATMPFARGEDVSGYGNNFGTNFSGNEQQYRIIARTATHDIYEWCVYNKGQEGRSVNSRGATIDTVLISSTYTPPVQVGKGNNTVRRSGGGGRGPIDAGIGTGQPRDLLNSMLSRLEEPGAVYLQIEGQGWDGTSNFPTTEIVPLTGPQTYSVRAGPIMWTSYKHVTTQHFGSFHFWWTLAMGENHFRLNINWHTGIPRPELLVRGIRLRIRGSTAPSDPGDEWTAPIAAFDPQYNGRWSQWSILSDPALGVVPTGDDNGFYILKNAPAGQYWHMPRMAQRAWRLNIWPQPVANPGQDRGWGVGDWSGGGFLLKDLKIWGSMLDHVGSDPANEILSKVNGLQSDLLNLLNRSERGGQNPTSLGPEYALFPVIEQAYGGPTGSESIYAPFPGVKAIAANERLGLAEHQILQLRMHSRSWVAMYETDGSPVRPWLHLQTGLANWSASLANRYFEMQSGGSVDQYAAWKDAGFGYSSVANRVIRTTRPVDFTDRIPLRLQPQAVNRGWGTHQGWPNVDQQHRGIHWPHDLALAWIDADPLSIQYLIEEAEMAHMQYWGASEGAATAGIRGAWGGGAFPGTQGSPCIWGRAEGWGFLIMSAAAPFTFPTVSAEDGDDPTITRADRWARGTIATFMDASEYVRSLAGISWHTNTDKLWDGFSGNPPWDAVANNGPFYSAQAFENSFLSLASAYAYTTWGEDFWISTRNGARVDVRAILNEYVRALDDIMWQENTAVASAAVVAGGSNYTNGDILTVTDDNLRTGLGSGSTIVIGNKAKLFVATSAAGVVLTVGVSNAGSYVQQPLDETALGGCFTHSEVAAASASTPGTGYANNQIITLNAGTPVRNAPENHAQFKVTSVNGSNGITGLSLVRTGRYEVPPATSLSGTQFSGGTGTGAVLSITRSSGGNGLRLNLAWAAPVRATRPSYPMKFFPVKKQGVAVPTWTSRADWNGTGDTPPRDMLVRAIFDSFAPGTEFNSQAVHSESIWCLLGCAKLFDSPRALKLACEMAGVTDGDTAALIAYLKTFGMGRIGGSQGIKFEMWWPIYAAFGAP